MIYNYKGYDSSTKSWIYGEKEIIVNQKDLSKRYFLVNENGKYEFKKENMKIYKGVEYYKFSDRYIILIDNMKVTRYTLKDVKTYINNYLIGE